MQELAARSAWKQNPVNRPAEDRLDFVPSMARLTLNTTKYWGAGGKELTVSFMGNVPAALRGKVLSHMNAWYDEAKCNVRFVPTSGVGVIRVSFGTGGYWSYLGTDCGFIPQNQPTMNLQGFRLETPESEYRRVVRHEAGHALGFPHEHLRRELVALLDEARTIAYYQRTQGWSEAQVRAQVLTPLEEQSVLGTDTADATSIMCYQVPGECTRNGKPIPGGLDLDADDKAFAASVYPRADVPVPPRPPAGGSVPLPASGKFKATRSGAAVTITLE